MTLDPRSWLTVASELAPGEKRYAEHDCGGGKKLLLSRDERGFSAWCFRCNESGWAPAPRLSLAEALELRERQERADVLAATETLPWPQVHDIGDWPENAAVWLYAAGLGRDDIGRLGIYYHPDTGRVVLPVFGTSTNPDELGDVVHWQARAVRAGHKPKYISASPARRGLICRWGHGATATLTEDILSAVKVSLAGGLGLALLGTHLQDHVLAYLVRRGGPVNVWLDPDEPGRAGATKVLRALRAVGLQARRIDSLRDPKLHTRSEVKEYLSWNSDPGF